MAFLIYQWLFHYITIFLMLGREKLIQEHQYPKRKEDVATVEKSPQAVALQL